MGHGSQDKALRRAEAQLDKAVARRDVEGAVAALFSLDKLEREPLLGRSASLVRQMLPELHRQSAWGRLHTLAARVEQEPRLLAHGADDATAAHARWPLLLACMRARDFARAQRMWLLLADLVAARAPALHGAIAAWVAGQGQVDASALAGLDLARLPEPAAVDPRLGVEPTARAPKAPPPAPPETADAVFDVVHLLFSTQSLRQASDILIAWQARATPDVAMSMRRLAASLATRELLLRASEGDRIGEAAQLLARLVQSAPNPADSANEILLAARFLVGMVATGSASRDEREALAGLMAALGRIPTFTPVAEAIAGDFAKIPALAPLALLLCEQVLASTPELAAGQFFPLWARALTLHSPRPKARDEERERRPAPPWLQSVSQRACARGDELAAYLKGLEGWARARLVDALVWGLPYTITVDLIDAAWKDATDEVRRDLVEPLDDLILDAEDASLERVMANPYSIDHAHVERAVAAAQAADPGLPFFAADGLKVWRRLGPRALPFNVRLLPFAIFDGKDPRRHFDLACTCVGQRTEIAAWLEIVDELRECDTAAVLPLLHELELHILQRYGSDRPALVRALIWGNRTEAPLRFMRDLACAYQRVALRPGDARAAGDKPELSADDKLAAKIAAFVLRFGAKTRSKPRPARKPKQKRPRAHQPAEQLVLPIDPRKP